MHKKKYRFINGNLFLVVFGLTLNIALANPLQVEEKPKFRVPQLEIRIPISQAYEIPANINDFRISKRITMESILDSYLASCRLLKIQPFSFDEGSDVYREIYKMQLIQLGVRPCPGYKEAAVNFLKTVESQLAGNPEVLVKFTALLKKGNQYLTRVWDFIQNDATLKKEMASLQKIASSLSALESYRSRFQKTKYFLPEERSHPAYLFYQLDFYKNRGLERFGQIIAEMKKADPLLIPKIEKVLEAYERGAQWLQAANLFFLKEKWFFDETQRKYKSIEDFLFEFWEPLLGHVPEIKPKIVRFGEIDGRAQDSAPWREYPQLLEPLNDKAAEFLKQASPRKISDLFEMISEEKAQAASPTIPEGYERAPLGTFIYSLKLIEEGRRRFTEAYDTGCPLTMMISNMPHEIAHGFHFMAKYTWKRAYSGNQKIHYQNLCNYVDEGLAEFCQLKSMEPILQKYPVLSYDNLLKHYIFGRKDTGNHHTWGLIWMNTLYEVLNNNVARFFFLLTESGVSLETIMWMPELQTEEVLAVSKSTAPIKFKRQRPRRPSTKVIFHPGFLIELDGEVFRIVTATK